MFGPGEVEPAEVNPAIRAIVDRVKEHQEGQMQMSMSGFERTENLVNKYVK